MNTIEFLKRVHPDRPWVLTAIEPSQKGIETRAFLPGDEDAAKEWIDENNGKRNLYWSVAEVKNPEDKKASVANVKAVHWLHVDIDADGSKDLVKELARIKALCTTALPDGAPKPTLVIYSGGGYQAFWELEEPIPIEGHADAAKEAARYNKQLELLFGGDSCSNVDRIMRLPGTQNIPNARKIAKGRVQVEATVSKAGKNIHALTAFTQAADTDAGQASAVADVQISGNVQRLVTVDDLDKYDVPDRVKVIIVMGNDPDTPKDGDNSRSAWLFDCVCQLVRADVPDDTIYSVITDPQFKIAESVLEANNVDAYAKRQIKSAKEFAVSPWLHKLNGEYAVIQDLGGRCLVVREVFDVGMDRHRLVKQTFTDFQNAYRNQFETVTGANGNPKSIPVGKWWLDNTKRRQYGRLVFAPGKETPGDYNLWQGYGCNAIPGKMHESFLAHLKDIICKGNEEHYRYLVGWLARTVQKPDQPGHTAVVMRGRQGTGKSFFAKHFGKLFGRHFLHVSNASHLVGNFNGHLRDAIVVFGDEAFYAGDKRHESVLKTLITEDSLMIEMKGVDAEASQNFAHLILASNSDWVVPVGAGDRRYFVVDVSEEHARDTVYFRGLARDLANGGYENLLHYLMTYDLSDYNVQVIPNTEARKSQQQESMEPHEEWWLSVLEDGQLAGDTWERGKQLTVANALVMEHYNLYAINAAQHRKVSPTKLGIFLSRMLPGDYPLKLKKRVDGRPENVRTFPTLDEARECWDRISGAAHDWHDIALIDGDDGAMPF